MNRYTVVMESGHEYYVNTDSEQAARDEAERLARVVHGVLDFATSVHEQRNTGVYV